MLISVMFVEIATLQSLSLTLKNNELYSFRDLTISQMEQQFIIYFIAALTSGAACIMVQNVSNRSIG